MLNGHVFSIFIAQQFDYIFRGGGHINQFYIFDIPFQTTNFLLSFALTMKNCLHMM
jgi:hypothetical protein